MKQSAAFDEIFALRHRRASVPLVILPDLVGFEEISFIFLRLLLPHDVVLARHILRVAELLQNVLIVFELLLELDPLLLRALLPSLACRRLAVHRQLVLLNVELLVTVAIVGAGHDASEATQVRVFPCDLLRPVVVLVQVDFRLRVVVVVLVPRVVVRVFVVFDSLQQTIADPSTIFFEDLWGWK